MNNELTFFATCPKGLEDLLVDEVKTLAEVKVRSTVGGVYFYATLKTAYGLCLWSRVANRVLLILNDPDESPPIATELALYSTAADVAWEDHMDASTSFSVDFIGKNKAIQNTQFGAVRVKDAIVDRMRAKTGDRPSVDKQNPQLKIQARLTKGKVQLGLDLCGVSLHQRGYRTEQGAAPVKENLAAAILLRSGWLAHAKAGNGLIDPMCGSGTFLVEAALMALDIAPGLYRERFGFHNWKQHQPNIWEALRTEAEDRSAKGKAAGDALKIVGIDEDKRVLNFASNNIKRAGLSAWIELDEQGIQDFQRPSKFAYSTGLVICNPPYGERLGQVEQLRTTYQNLGKVIKEACAGWQLAIFTGNPDLAKEMRLRPKKSNKFLNGSLPCELYLYDLLSADEAVLRKDREGAAAKEHLTENTQMVVNRLRKNIRKISKWIKKNQINAYRIYDADMPEYSAAVDVYDGKIHLQEYAAPKNIPEETTNKRLRELLQAVAYVFEVNITDIAVKTRRRNRGKSQYEKFETRSEFQVVHEGSARFKVNLWDYLDTGLFLDHRLLRLRLANESHGKRFLNLFCYTATATVHAALGGAASSVSVDMSNTYLDWANRNFELNHINISKHELIQEDCLKWLASCRQGFDLILLDPPTFSNSKKMEGVLDIQRDHVTLVKRCMEILTPGGKLYFSNNLRGFKLDATLKESFKIEDISETTIDTDFERNKKIHHCYLIEQL